MGLQLARIGCFDPARERRDSEKTLPLSLLTSKRIVLASVWSTSERNEGRSSYKPVHSENNDSLLYRMIPVRTMDAKRLRPLTAKTAQYT